MDSRQYACGQRAEAGGADGPGEAAERPRWRVLVADDEPAIVTLLSDMLTSAGLEVLCASGGAEAVTLARRETPNLVILDVMMPDLDGREACQALKHHETLHGVPVILISEADEHAIDWRAAGADSFHRKTLDPRAFPAVVERFLRSRA